MERYCKRITQGEDLQKKKKKTKRKLSFWFSFAPGRCNGPHFPDEIARQLFRSSFRDTAEDTELPYSRMLCARIEVERRGCAESLIRCLWLLGVSLGSGCYVLERRWVKPCRRWNDDDWERWKGRGDRSEYPARFDGLNCKANENQTRGVNKESATGGIAATLPRRVYASIFPGYFLLFAACSSRWLAPTSPSVNTGISSHEYCRCAYSPLSKLKKAVCRTFYRELGRTKWNMSSNIWEICITIRAGCPI